MWRSDRLEPSYFLRGLLAVTGLWGAAEFAGESLAGAAASVQQGDTSTEIAEPDPESGDWLRGWSRRLTAVHTTPQRDRVVIENGWLRREFLIQAGSVACVAFQQGYEHQALIRAIRPEAQLTIDGQHFEIGGVQGSRIGNFLGDSRDLVVPPATQWELVEWREAPIAERMEWKRRSAWSPQELPWPPPGRGLVFSYRFVGGVDSPLSDVTVHVHYEVYDGLPLICKWLSVENRGSASIRINRFVSESLAAVEASSQVEDLADPRTPNWHIETNYPTCSMEGSTAQVDAVRWLPDPNYETQVNYRRETRCLLECGPSVGPEVDVAAGATWESFRTWLLILDSRDETRRCLALNRLYRVVAPWTQENPLIHHVRSADEASVRLAIDQAAEVGFDMVIMTFGSGFNIENEDPAYLQQIKTMADYAHQRGVALGGYSLLASRSVGPEHDVINPETGQPGGFARFGQSPCLESHWGQDYFRKLKQFFEVTGCDVLEHDGSYPGDGCASEEHPGHRDWHDSRWQQWQRISGFYQWCRSQGIYLNVPDWYFLQGSNKTGMGYRETNWSLPRSVQEIIERQNIVDGTRFKTPSMGWMFVPLTEYHGGGPAATIEPLDQHRDHYERRLQNLWGAGVQACFRGPRLYDTPATQQMVKRWVGWYRQHREILDSPLIPLRRADGGDWDGWIHVNPGASCPGMVVLFNPTPQSIQRRIRIPAYYTGLTGSVRVSTAGAAPIVQELNERQELYWEGELPAQGMLWLTLHPDE